MMKQITLLPDAVSELFASVAQTGKLTLADRYGLMAALLHESLDEEEITALNRLLRAVMRGKVAIAAEQNLLNRTENI